MFPQPKFYLFLITLFLITGCKKELISSDKELLSFTIESKNNPSLSADLVGTFKGDTITFILPSDTMAKKLVATVVVSPGARVVPGDKEQKDFTTPVLYTVAAPDGTVRNYIAVCKPKTSLKIITSFKFEKSANTQLPIDIIASVVNDTIKFRLPEGISTTLLPVITVNAGASITNIISSTDFATPVRYTIKAEDGSTKTVVTKIVFVAPPKLKNFTINNGTGAYVKSTNTYYFPVTPGTSLNNYVVGYDTLASPSVRFGTKTVAKNGATDFPLATNQEFKIEAFDEFNRSQSYNMIITGMPVVQLKTDYAIGDDYVNAAFTITDNEYMAHNGPLFLKSNIVIKKRGETSRSYAKNQYAVSMRDASYGKIDVSVLGLRTDKDWILDAMYIDAGRMRNRLCTDIWNSMNNVPYIAKEPDAINGTRGYMVEAFLNDEYLGVFCMTEKLDRKQLKVKKATGMVYKADDWAEATLFHAALPYSNASSEWSGFEFNYPEIGDSPAPNWKPLSTFVDFVANSGDDAFVSQIASKVNIDNVVDYLLFSNATGSVDNMGKNCFLSFYDTSSDPRFFLSVWDLDATFGRNYNGEYYQKYPSDYVFLDGDNYLFTRLLRLNPNNFVQKFKTRWNSLKNNQLSKATVSARIENFRKQLSITKAGEREIARWAVPQDFDTEAAYMTSWYSTHYDFLNNYINSL